MRSEAKVTRVGEPHLQPYYWAMFLPIAILKLLVCSQIDVVSFLAIYVKVPRRVAFLQLHWVFVCPPPF